MPTVPAASSTPRSSNKVTDLTTTPTTPEIKEESDGNSEEPLVVTISRCGDLVLDVSKEGSKEHALFKVEQSKLTKASKYFTRLLDPDGFREGKSLVEQRERLRKLYPILSDVPDEDLPRVAIADIGQTSVLKSIKPIVTDFLKIVHGHDIANAAKSPISNIANLAIMADRFDTRDALCSWVLSKKTLAPRIFYFSVAHDETICRQRILTCLFLGNRKCLARYSSQLILQGSVMWKNAPPDHKEALWWDLPRGIEEELQFRRMCVLDTIKSLQDHILGLYTTSKARQCKLGYDSSPQCDDFQLGQFIRFLTRIGTLRFTGSLFDAEEPETFTGHIRNLVKDLRACPSYQIDANHSHCGAKKLLTAGLDTVEKLLGEALVGICYECWRVPDSAQCWVHAKRLPFYNGWATFWSAMERTGDCNQKGGHDNARDFFMADDRTWITLLY